MGTKGQSSDSVFSGKVAVAAISAPGVTDSVVVSKYSLHSPELIVASMAGAGTQVVRVEVSSDGTNWRMAYNKNPYAPLYDATGTTTTLGDVTITANGNYTLPSFIGAFQKVRLRVVNETDAAAVYTFAVSSADQ